MKRASGGALARTARGTKKRGVMQASEIFTCDRLAGTLAVATCLNRIKSYDVITCTSDCEQAQTHGLELQAVKDNKHKKQIQLRIKQSIVAGYAKKLKPEQRCQEADCDDEYYAKGYCQKHYKKHIVMPKWRERSMGSKKQENSGNGEVVMPPVDTCSIEGCTSPLKHKGLKLCNAHYLKYLKNNGRYSKNNQSNVVDPAAVVDEQISREFKTIIVSEDMAKSKLRTALLAQLFYISELVDAQIEVVISEGNIDCFQIFDIRKKIGEIVSISLEADGI